MSGIDGVQVNTRERPSSSDINDLQSMSARQILDSIGASLQLRIWGALTASPGTYPLGVVLGGLSLSPDGNNVQVDPGTLMQWSETLDPVPGPLDSPFRIGTNRVAQILVTPSPVSNTWYLIEAQVLRVVTLTDNRDVLDPGTGNFVPTMLDKKYEYRVDFQFVAGSPTQLPVPTGGDWVMLGAVFRPAGGGPVLASNLMDMRRTPSQADAPVVQFGALTQRSYVSSVDLDSGGVYFSQFDADGQLGGQRCWFHLQNALFAWNGLSAEIIDAVNDPTLLAHGEWYYLYLAPFSTAMPVGQPLRFLNILTLTEEVVSGGFQRGVLVASTIPPATQGGNYNGASLTLPAPFSNVLCPTGNAILLGAFQRTGAGILAARADNNFVQLSIDGHHESDRVVKFGTWSGGTNVNIPIPDDRTPVSARSMRTSFNFTPNTGNTGLQSAVGVRAYSLFNTVFQASYSNNSRFYFEFDFPLVSQGYADAKVDEMFISQSNAAEAGAGSLIMLALGFTEGVM